MMEPRYDPTGVEERWQQTWEKEGLYNADPDPSRPAYVDAHPPPNVTGELHMGHALQLALGDTVIRMKRMQGFNALFQPGYDHAGISTQNAVEKQLLKEGTSRQELGREAFEARVWEWLHEVGGKIMFQFRRMGASLDYRRERFTMDPGYVRAVLRFFVHLYDNGLDLPREPDHQLVPVPPHLAVGPRARRTRTATTSSRRSATRLRTATATSRSRPSGPPRSPRTSRSPCIRTTTATSI